METAYFTAWDYIVFVLMLLISTLIGLYYGCTGRKQNTTKEFLMADRSMSALPVSLSMLASFMSAITVLGTPAEMYVFGSQYWMVWIGYCITIPLAAHFFLPVFYNLTLTSVFEYLGVALEDAEDVEEEDTLKSLAFLLEKIEGCSYLEMRYDRGIRLIVSICYIIQTILYMAIVLYTPALALTIVTGLNVWVSVFSVGLVCIFYTALGGMKAVMWTDVFQVGIMFIGLFAIIIKGSIDHGGFGNIWNIMNDGERIQFWDFNPDPRVRHSIWSLSIGGGFTWLAIYGVNQAQVQRALCTPTLRTGQTAYWVNLPGLTALLTICSMCGFVVYAEYRNCDPLTGPDPIKKDQLLPFYVINHLRYPLIPGLFTASVFSGALSTVSSGLNSLAAVVLQDMVKAFCYPNMQESTATNLSRGLAIGFGALMMLLTYVASQLGGVLQAALGLFGMIGGPTLGLFMMAMTNPWSNTVGAYFGFIIGLMATIWLGIGAFIYKPSVYKPSVSRDGCPGYNDTMYNDTFTTDMMYSTTAAAVSRPEDKPGYSSFYEISYLYYSLFAIIVVNVVGTVVSLIAGGNNPDSIDPRLLTPVVESFLCCLPRKFRRCIQCNIDRTHNDDDDLESKPDVNGGKSYANDAYTIDTKM